MKRILIPAVMAMMALGASAQVLSTQLVTSGLKELEVSKLVHENTPMSFYSCPVSKVAKAPMAQFNIYADNGDGVYYAGITDEGAGFQNYTAAFGPMGAPAYFRPYVFGDDTSVEYTTSWYYTTTTSGNVPMEKVNGQGMLNIVGVVEYPILVVTASDGTSLEFNRGNSELAATQGAVYSNLFNHEFPLSMNDHGVTIPSEGYYGGYTVISDGDTLAMSIGTGAGVKRAAEVYTAPSTPLVVYGGNMMIFSGIDGKNPSFINGSSLTVELWTCELDENYNLTLNDKLKSATLGASDYVLGSPDNLGYNGLLSYTFTRVDDFGMEVDDPAVVPAGTQFAIVVDGFDNPDVNTCMALIPSGTYYRPEAHGYFEPEDFGVFVYPFYEQQAPSPQMDLFMSIRADLPRVVWGSEEMEAPVEGGYLQVEYTDETGAPQLAANNQIYTSMPIEENSVQNFTWELPDWVSIESCEAFQGTWNSSAGCGYFTVFTAQQLPDGVDGRSGYIRLHNPITGMNWGIKVGQGEWDPNGMESGVESAKAQGNNAYVYGDQLNLTYGECCTVADVYNVAGVKVASYQLPEGGSYTASVSGLADGVYVVVFNGAKTATVKFVK